MITTTTLTRIKDALREGHTLRIPEIARRSGISSRTVTLVCQRDSGIDYIRCWGGAPAARLDPWTEECLSAPVVTMAAADGSDAVSVVVTQSVLADALRGTGVGGLR